MMNDNELHEQLKCVLASTNFSFLGERYEGKVRDRYSFDDVAVLVTTDRLSCFDVVVTTIPFKGQVLNQIAVHWFELCKDIIQSHIIDVPDENVMIGQRCEVLPIEVVVRGYLAGSAWRDYEAGKLVSGVKLPPGLKKHQKLPSVTLTPSTKAARGVHDEPISEEEIIRQGIVTKSLWGQVRGAALALFSLGSSKALEQGLILVDTKYEFGLKNGKLLLADEIHTLDSSRYWVAATYDKAFSEGATPEMLDKEPTRQWLLSKGYKGEGKIPEFTDDHRVEIAKHYVRSYEKITGKTFIPSAGDPLQRIERRLKEWANRRPRG